MKTLIAKRSLNVVCFDWLVSTLEVHSSPEAKTIPFLRKKTEAGSIIT